MAFSSWRGIVGIIKPTMRPGGLEDLIRILPEGIGVLPLYNNIRRGDRAEFKQVMQDYDEKVAMLHLSKIGVNLTKLRPDQASYIGVKVEGPFKSDHYRY